ncbi:HWE histidine kinase domain-containing protein [Microvirga sp. 2TAF3]|uniref:HWE histidine kinase domain-containing protein n=1 Tax=Microvirga sp. 2TAF3 TaxID=3233014 RepID=UPI003F945BF3
MRGRVALIMGLLGIVFICLTFGFIAWEQRSRLIQRNESDLKNNAFFLADHAARLLEVTDLTLRQTAALIEDESWYTIEPSRQLWDQLRAIKQALPYVEDIWLNDASGKLRLTSFRFPTPEGNVNGRDAFDAQVKSDQGLFVGTPIVGRITNAPTFLVSRRLQYPTGAFRGIVSVTVSPSYFNDYWERLQLPKRSRVSLLRAADAKVIVQQPVPQDSISFIPADKNALDRALASNRESGLYTDVRQGERRIGAYHQVGDFPLYIRVSMPEDAYWDPWIAQTKIYGSFALIALIALLALMMLAAYQFQEHAANAALLEKKVVLRTGELRKETAALEVLNRTGSALAAEFDINRIVQSVIDAGVELAGAQVGAFLYKAALGTDGSEEGKKQYSMVYALSGASREAFGDLTALRHTPLFSPTFVSGQAVRSDDITTDPRCGQNSPFNGAPKGHLPVRSYLAVPVVSRTGNIQGALLFGHERPGIFTARTERLMSGLAGQAAIALENGNLYQAAQYEIEERKQAQAQQSLLIRELHHRVKNTLATVQAVVGATARSTSNIDDFYGAFVGRIISLANTHSLLTEAVWQTASLREILEKELSPYNDDTGERITIEGPAVELPSEAAVPIGMAIHELTTNAAKYGALSVAAGRVAVRWMSEIGPEGMRLKLAWTEQGGPPVKPPKRQGFGSRLLHRVLTTQLDAKVEMDFERTGLIVSIDAVLKSTGFLDPAA